MHRVLESHLDEFRAEHGIDASPSKAFEAFVAFCLARRYTSDSFEPSEQVYEGADPGIDSILFIADDMLISSAEELLQLFERRRRDVPIYVLFIQTKTGEDWAKKDINNFQTAVLDFLSEAPRYPRSEYFDEKRQIFDTIIHNVGKVHEGKPSVECYFATSARTPSQPEITASFDVFRDRLNDEGLFSTITVEPLDRDTLIRLWVQSSGPITASFKVFGSASFPKSPGIDESYVVTGSARDFVARVLADANGNLRTSIFDENVRDFLDIDNPVNTEIAKSLKLEDTSFRFGILNNGITIVSPDVRLQSNEMFIADYQIVNGCQTSHVLFDNRDQLTDDTTIMAKVIETQSPQIVEEIVRATNNQTRVEEHQFLAMMDAIKAIERYFVARGADEEHRLYLERRRNQYAKHNIPAVRIFDIKEIARCAGAMFFDRPELATRYPNQLVGELRDLVFRPDNREEIFYTAAYAYYRLKLHLGNKRIQQKYHRVKWYLLMGIKYRICGEAICQPTSAKIVKACDQINEFVSRNDPYALDVWNELCRMFEPLEELTRDRLKGSSFVAKVKAQALEGGGVAG